MTEADLQAMAAFQKKLQDEKHTAMWRKREESVAPVQNLPEWAAEAGDVLGMED